MIELVDKKTASNEVEGWLDFKKVPASKRESMKATIDNFIDAICDGILTIDATTHVVTHNLSFPIGTDAKIEKFEYKPRINMGTVNLHLQGVKSSDADGRLCAYVAALTSKPKAVIVQMDTEDNAIAQLIALFFL